MRRFVNNGLGFLLACITREWVEGILRSKCMHNMFGSSNVFVKKKSIYGFLEFLCSSSMVRVSCKKGISITSTKKKCSGKNKNHDLTRTIEVSHHGILY